MEVLAPMRFKNGAKISKSSELTKGNIRNTAEKSNQYQQVAPDQNAVPDQQVHRIKG